MTPKTEQHHDAIRIDWLEKYLIEAKFIINDSNDPVFRTVHTDESEEHLMITEAPTLRAAIDRAILSVHAQQS
jgi:hypothetical protein